MNIAARIIALAAAALLSACASTGAIRSGPVEVTRYHLGAAVVPGSVAVTTAGAFAGVSPEDALYTGAVAAELGRAGYSPVAGESSEFIALVSYSRIARGQVRERPPLTIGIGAGSFGGNVGVGADASFGIGGKTREVYATELVVQLKRRSDGTILWEGRAIAEAAGTAPAGQPGAVAQRLAAALFRGFPGESGITITVK
ncbi:DUF4136 domain-containing protein [Sphingomonas canadensis]|uniref:DUF4136 domain-containing protein n=2 Tax=Sphingomonas canadensis TaxID=1219257 RepID=A0ABW3HAA1_9SPHN|nr:DUF4136 domain-containing protein [Sphingomonas canadensis]